jgi:phage gp46-like protein
MIGFSYDPATMTCDLALGPQGLAHDDGLATVVLASLLSDARAAATDRLPAGVTDPRGWCGDVLADPAFVGDGWGSKLWLLSREKQTEETRRRAIEIAEAALAWLITDGAASAVAVDAAWVAIGRLALTVTVTLRPTGALVVVPLLLGA